MQLVIGGGGGLMSRSAAPACLMELPTSIVPAPPANAAWRSCMRFGSVSEPGGLRPLFGLAGWCNSVVSVRRLGERTYSDLTGISRWPLRIP